jgi:hypothetical protein
VVVALAASALFAIPATPALAEDPTVTITSVNASLNAGQTTTLTFSVRNNNGPVFPATSANIRVSSSFSELRCTNNCDFTDTIGAGDTKSYSATLKAGNVAAGQERSGSVQITVQIGDDSSSASRSITVKGPEIPEVQTVAEVSGKVINGTTGEAVSGATVRLRDAQGHTYTKSTSSSGAFRFTGSQSSPITPGSLELRATKDGVTETLTVNGANGQRVTGRNISLALAGADPTPTATPSEETTEDSETDEEEATEEEPTEAAADSDQNSASNQSDGGGTGSLLLILAGGLLVALGVGAIVLLLMRRKEEGDEDEPHGPRGGSAAAGRGYSDEPTRVTNRAAGGASDATMVTGPSLADAPTMMHNAPLVDDEFPDPYGAPPPSPQSGPPGYGGGGPQQGWDEDGGYGGRPGSGAGAYGAAPASGPGYGDAPGSGAGAGYGAPVSGGGYRSGGDGYDDRYDEPTGRYTGRDDDYGPPADPYDSGGYGPTSGAGGYDATQRYDQGGGYDDGTTYGGGRGGYDDQGGYGRADDGYGDDYQTRAGGYGQQGYDDRGGYDQPTTGAGYDQRGRGGYDDQGGYDDRGYDQQGGYYDDPSRTGGHSRSGVPHQGGRGGRRSLDWLDD